MCLQGHPESFTVDAGLPSLSPGSVPDRYPNARSLLLQYFNSKEAEGSAWPWATILDLGNRRLPLSMINI